MWEEITHLDCMGKYHCMAELVHKHYQPIYFFACIQFSQTDGQAYTNTSPYNVKEDRGNVSTKI